MLLIPWFSLLFVEKKVIKRYMPAGLFAAITSLLIIDMGVVLNWWTIRENIYPLKEALPLTFGFFLAAEIWIFKYTYKSFWIYSFTQLFLGTIFIFELQPWLSLRGIWVRINATNFLAFLPVIPHFVSIYLFQMWQEDALAPAIKNLFMRNLQPAARKPRLDDSDNNNSR
jgi:hypothetical protein